PGCGSYNDVGEAVGVDVACRHMHATGEAREGEEALEQSAGLAIKDLDVPAWRPRVGPDDDIVEAVIVDVARADRHAAGGALESEEAVEQGAGLAVEDLGVSTRRPRSGADDGVEDAIAVDVADRHADGPVVPGEGEETGLLRAPGGEGLDGGPAGSVGADREDVGRRDGEAAGVVAGGFGEPGGLVRADRDGHWLAGGACDASGR